jgi:hypothetical protein
VLTVKNFSKECPFNPPQAALALTKIPCCGDRGFQVGYGSMRAALDLLFGQERGLYLDPPERALVLCVDEKSQIHYLAEFDFRYSNRVRLGVDDVERTRRALKGIVGKRLTYRPPRGRETVWQKPA